MEDQESLAKLLKKGFEKEGYAADYLLDGEAGQKRIELHNQDYDLVVLDLDLPKRSGEEVCRAVKQAGVSIPILILTAKDTLSDKVLLLDWGADDYLVKPFEFAELLARTRALLRRPSSVLPPELSARGLSLNPATKQVSYNDKNLPLTLTEFRLLEYLMRHLNQVVEREDIVSNVWDFDFDSFSNIIDVYINRLRCKFNKAGAGPFIETVRGVGYKIIS